MEAKKAVLSSNSSLAMTWRYWTALAVSSDKHLVHSAQRKSSRKGAVLDNQLEARGFGEKAEISVAREERDSTLNAALRYQCVP